MREFGHTSRTGVRSRKDGAKGPAERFAGVPKYAYLQEVDEPASVCGYLMQRHISCRENSILFGVSIEKRLHTDQHARLSMLARCLHQFVFKYSGYEMGLSWTEVTNDIMHDGFITHRAVTEAGATPEA